MALQAAAGSHRLGVVHVLEWPPRDALLRVLRLLLLEDHSREELLQLLVGVCARPRRQRVSLVALALALGGAVATAAAAGSWVAVEDGNR